ncbi:MAG: hypothetical protein Q4D29_06990 [Lachnospiraceae bacterium]|nr:hypothetical protein [Lachnospiraceae bacterium]
MKKSILIITIALMSLFTTGAASHKHSFSAPTCTSPKVCSICEETAGEDLGHKFENGECSRCGAIASSEKSIQDICDLRAACQKDISICVVNIDEDHNPYDVEYNYGNGYKSFVELCDWSLVFDADYYIKTYPMLAKLYHKDKDLLLEHFQTIGIHEGRQGCNGFNVGAYYYNCDDKVYKAFKKNWEGYYIYYMLNYDSEKDVNTVEAKGEKKTYRQYKIVKTAQQASEFSNINKYRKKAGAEEVQYNSELQALANYRAYVNSKENWDAHDWAKTKKTEMDNLVNIVCKDYWKFAENNVTTHVYSLKGYRGSDNSRKYYGSKEHYDAMVNTKYNYCGVSNNYVGVNNQKNTYKKSSPYEGSQFDVYSDSVKTPLKE